MHYKNIYDLHTHSQHSFDGNNSVYDICIGAIKNHAVGIAITDHCDIGMNDIDLLSFAEKQYNDTLNAKTEHKDILKVYQGIELGQGFYDESLSNQILDKYDYDIVIGSIHNLKNMEDFYFLDYSKLDINSLLTDYFNTVLELVKWNKTDTLAHLTYPFRYIVERENINIDISRFYDIIDKIFETLILNEKALELNVSGLFMTINNTLPDKGLIRRFHDMGGKYVTVGSDSHYSDKVCMGIEAGYDMLKECGYTHFTIFEKRKPVLIEIK